MRGSLLCALREEHALRESGYVKTELLGIITVKFDVTDQRPVRYRTFVRHWKNNVTTGEACSYL
jgi:hypothetical protein